MNPIALPLGELVPPPELFLRESETHGQKHVARVMIHAFLLLRETGNHGLARPLWASVYLHDLARTHDGRCLRHGRDAVERLPSLEEVGALFTRAGLGDGDLEAVRFAVAHHCGGAEAEPGHPHRTLTALLKDADGLDRVRLGDLDPDYLRFPVTPRLIPFARRLHRETHRLIAEGPDHFERLWPAATELLAEAQPGRTGPPPDALH